MDEIFIPLAVIGFTLTVLSPYFFNKYTKYKLEIEKLRLQSEIRKEEIRAKNQFDIEKYMADEQLKAGRKQAAASETPIDSEMPILPQYQTSMEAVQRSAGLGMQPDFNDIRKRSYVNGTGTKENDLLNDSRSREKLRY